MKRKIKKRKQYAALPYIQKDGQTLVMLVTSRETKRWIIPKGWAEKKTAPHAVAAQEAFEEAGLRGTVQEKPFARYEYVKRLKSGKGIPCLVDIFLFHVEKELDDWPEKAERERKWMTAGEAALAVGESRLIEILLAFSV